ncbi:MAG: hypothetical protein F6J90_09030 [Moorea sp. SIOASIH]|uniref:hypothetical protein n=1 Tax=Moorena sp. SIOASIH TaxID=2607817 RepID=UPI0013B883BE|nr:hypothetical protein [Moorena sp. SIOASIH]NEO36456.1 hypothetical protein [Moorena sp. SIOASIH]
MRLAVGHATRSHQPKNAIGLRPQLPRLCDRLQILNTPNHVLWSIYVIHPTTHPE